MVRICSSCVQALVTVKAPHREYLAQTVVTVYPRVTVAKAVVIAEVVIVTCGSLVTVV